MFCINLTDGSQQFRFLLKGDHLALGVVVKAMEAHGCSIGIGAPPEGLLLPELIVPRDFEEIPQQTRVPWIVWNSNNIDGMRRYAQESGCLCALGAEFSAAALLNALQTAALVSGAFNNTGMLAAPSQKRNFERGDQIHLDEDRVVHIRRGIVRCSSIHPDGSEVLIGFYGEGDALLAHASHDCHSHSCHVEMRAHTNLAVTVEPWKTAVERPDFYERLKERICQMEVWASMQARSTVEGRLLGILECIGGRFSVDVEGGVRLNIRLTHEQLAGAIGATRTTVTRLLGDLKRRGVLMTDKTPMGEFFILAEQVEHCHHH